MPIFNIPTKRIVWEHVVLEAPDQETALRRTEALMEPYKASGAHVVTVGITTLDPLSPDIRVTVYHCRHCDKVARKSEWFGGVCCPNCGKLV